MSIFISFAILVVLGALAAAGYFMVKDNSDAAKSKRENGMVKALTVRIGVSVLLFLCILLAWSLGWITPSGLPMGK